MKYLRLMFMSFILSVAVVACQKDEAVDPVEDTKATTADTAKRSLLNSPGSFLAMKGSLEVTLADSTYTFDATTDSIAFVNVLLDSNKYFGITAINKAHTISFGISAMGTAAPNINSNVAGSQMLFNNGDKAVSQHTLSKHLIDAGKIYLSQYLQDSTSARGTFYTLFSQPGAADTKPAKVTGSFNLTLK